MKYQEDNTMIHQIDIFSERDSVKLKEKVNKFLKESEVEVVNIQYQILNTYETGEEGLLVPEVPYYTALIHYKTYL